MEKRKRERVSEISLEAHWLSQRLDNYLAPFIVPNNGVLSQFDVDVEQVLELFLSKKVLDWLDSLTAEVINDQNLLKESFLQFFTEVFSSEYLLEKVKKNPARRRMNDYGGYYVSTADKSRDRIIYNAILSKNFGRVWQAVRQKLPFFANNFGLRGEFESLLSLCDLVYDPVADQLVTKESLVKRIEEVDKVREYATAIKPIEGGEWKSLSQVSLVLVRSRDNSKRDIGIDGNRGQTSFQIYDLLHWLNPRNLYKNDDLELYKNQESIFKDFMDCKLRLETFLKASLEADNGYFTSTEFTEGLGMQVQKLDSFISLLRLDGAIDNLEKIPTLAKLVSFLFTIKTKLQDLTSFIQEPPGDFVDNFRQTKGFFKKTMAIFNNPRLAWKKEVNQKLGELQSFLKESEESQAVAVPGTTWPTELADFTKALLHKRSVPDSIMSHGVRVDELRLFLSRPEVVSFFDQKRIRRPFFYSDHKSFNNLLSDGPSFYDTEFSQWMTYIPPIRPLLVSLLYLCPEHHILVRYIEFLDIYVVNVKSLVGLFFKHLERQVEATRDEINESLKCDGFDLKLRLLEKT